MISISHNEFEYQIWNTYDLDVGTLGKMVDPCNGQNHDMKICFLEILMTFYKLKNSI